MKAKVAYHDLVRRDALALLTGPAGRVLDFGGGVGATAAALREAGQASHAVLFDQVAGHAVPGIDAAEAVDLEDAATVAALLTRHGPFDTILCLDILEHLRDPWGIVAALEQTLAPGGRLLVSVPNISSLTVLKPLILRDRFDYCDSGVLDRTHLRWFTRRSAIALTRGKALEIERVSHGTLRRRNRVINRLTFRLLERFLSDQYLVLARQGAKA